MIAMAPPDSDWIPLSSSNLTKMVSADIREASGFHTGTNRNTISTITHDEPTVLNAAGKSLAQ